MLNYHSGFVFKLVNLLTDTHSHTQTPYIWSQWIVPQLHIDLIWQFRLYLGVVFSRSEYNTSGDRLEYDKPKSTGLEARPKCPGLPAYNLKYTTVL